MPGRIGEFGKYGARGIKGSEAVARQLDKLVTYIASSVTSVRGLAARLTYLTRTKHAREEARQAGFDPSNRLLKKWQDGTQKPNKANLKRIDDAYRALRRQNVEKHLLKRLEANGGTRVEIHPFNQSAVPRPRQRSIGHRNINIRHWDRIVRAWANDDDEALEDAWIDQIADIGSDWGEYQYVTNVGFAA